MDKNEFNKELIRRYRDNKASYEELEVLFQLMNEGKLDEELKEIMKEEAKENVSVKRIPVYKQTWFRVAAAVLLLAGAFVIYKLADTKNKADKNLANAEVIKQDVAPGGDKAVLKLADGTQIILDSTSNGDIASQGKTKIIKLNGQLSYAASGNNAEILYNTITTPRGGQYQLILADGTKVWLNAASSLRFPATFSGTERKVELTGEGYFEVAKNAAMPFKVAVNDMTVEVLGTHFNINSYLDEASVKTTLLEGAVKVINNGAVQLLSPGNQAQLTADGQIRINKNVDVEDVVAWKNGVFNFSSADIENIMRQISRWYDLDVSYEGTISQETFSGIVSRSSNLSQVLKIMEQAGVKFKIEGKKLIVM